MTIQIGVEKKLKYKDFLKILAIGINLANVANDNQFLYSL